MPNIATVVERLNDAVRRDWKAIHNLVEYRVPTNTRMAEHPNVIVVPYQTDGGANFLVGMLGVLNGVCRETDQCDPIEAVFDDRTHELMGFKLRSDERPAVDQRAVAISDLQEGQRYRVTDRAGNRWEGRFAGVGNPQGEQGVHLRLNDGSTALIYFHDVAQLIRA